MRQLDLLTISEGPTILRAIHHISGRLRQGIPPVLRLPKDSLAGVSEGPGLSHNREVGNWRSGCVVLSLARQKEKGTAVFLLEINF